MKQTEIGLIPDDWEVKRLGEIYSFKYGEGNKNPNNSGMYPIYGANGIIGKYTKYNAEDSIVIGHMGEYAGSVIWAEGKHFVTYNGTITKPKDQTIVEPKYGFYALYDRNINAICTGSGYPFLAYDKLNAIQIALPPFAEQQRIAKALSDVDAVISTTEKLLQKKKNIKQGAMQNLLTGKKRLPGFATTSKFKQTELGEIPEDWEVKALEELCSLITKQTGFDYSATIKPALVTEPKKNTLPFIQNKDFEEEKINFKTDFFIPDEIAKKFPKIYLNEDVLLISISGRIGNVAYFKHTQDAFIGGAVGIAHFYNKHIIKYCMRYLLSPNGQKQIFANEKSGAQHNLTIADVRKLSIPMPANNDELTAITNVLSSMDKEIETLNTKLEKYRNLKTAMMQQLLTGKIRLK